MKWMMRTTAAMVLLISYIMVYAGCANFNREEVIVAVLDTGVDSEHPLLRGKVIQGWDFADQDRDSSDDDGHGTHVAGIILEKAPNAKILSVRVIKNDDVMNTGLAILYAITQGADIVNMSFVEPYHPFTEMAIQYGKSKGVVFVASSGNQNQDKVLYPAKYDEVISVTATDESLHYVYGNYGRTVNFAAPGMNIRSASLDGGYLNMTGTSMSAAYMSGVMAYLKSMYPSMGSEDLEDYLNTASITRNDLVLYASHETMHRPFKVIDYEQVQRLVRMELASGSESVEPAAALRSEMQSIDSYNRMPTIVEMSSDHLEGSANSEPYRTE
ncbi:S8 family peptidase [Marinicrinis lubricantis]|uniref:S8 family serine peptidase n=1 Tax=Marinicrinis lubricantis TaxID=2086470 RepID=A0ABW1ITC7_9BACL